MATMQIEGPQNLHQRITSAVLTLRHEPNPQLRELAGSLFITLVKADMPDFNEELFRHHANMLPTAYQQAAQFMQI